MFIYTKHAVEKMNALGIEKRDIESVISKGMKWKETGSEKWHAQMAGTEIVFMKRDEYFFVITAYLAERLK